MLTVRLLRYNVLTLNNLNLFLMNATYLCAQQYNNRLSVIKSLSYFIWCNYSYKQVTLYRYNTFFLIKFISKKIFFIFLNYFEHKKNKFLIKDKNSDAELFLQNFFIFFEDTLDINQFDFFYKLPLFKTHVQQLATNIRKYNLTSMQQCYDIATDIFLQDTKNTVHNTAALLNSDGFQIFYEMQYSLCETKKNYCELYLMSHNFSYTLYFLNFNIIAGNIYIFALKANKTIELFNFIFTKLFFKLFNFFLSFKLISKTYYLYYKHKYTYNAKLLDFFSSFVSMPLNTETLKYTADLFFYNFFEKILTQPNEIQPNEIQPNEIQTNEIQTNEIQDNEIQDNKIQDNEIQDNEIQDNEIQDNEIISFKIQQLSRLNFDHYFTVNFEKNQNKLTFNQVIIYTKEDCNKTCSNNNINAIEKNTNSNLNISKNFLNFKFSVFNKNINKIIFSCSSIVQINKKKKVSIEIKLIKKIEKILKLSEHYNINKKHLNDHYLKDFKKNTQLKNILEECALAQQQYATLQHWTQQLIDCTALQTDDLIDEDLFNDTILDDIIFEKIAIQEKELEDKIRNLNKNILSMFYAHTNDFFYNLQFDIEMAAVYFFERAVFKSLFLITFCKTDCLLIFHPINIFFYNSSFFYKLFLQILDEIMRAQWNLKNNTKNKCINNICLSRQLINFFIIFKLWHLKNIFYRQKRTIITDVHYLQHRQFSKNITKLFKKIKINNVKIIADLYWKQNMFKQIRQLPQINHKFFIHFFLYIIPQNYIYVYVCAFQNIIKNNNFIFYNHSAPVLTNFLTNFIYFFKNIRYVTETALTKSKAKNNFNIYKKISFFTNFLSNFIEHLVSTNVSLNFFFLQNKSILEKHFTVIFKRYFKHLVLKRSKNNYFLFKAFLVLLIFKDLIFFKNWFCNFLELIKARFHRKMLSQFNKLLKYFFKHILIYFGCSGFKLIISGKISVTGNAKKRRYYLNMGTTSFTKKYLKLSYAQGTIRTLTGVLGIVFLLSNT